MSRLLPAAVVLLLALAPLAAQDDPAKDAPVFSGPQKGEKLAPFEVKRVYGDDAGKSFDPVAAADGKPLAIVFFHERTRPAFGLMRTVMGYAGTRAKDGLASTIVFLAEDPTETEKWLGQVNNLMPKEVTIAVGKDGIEGPGAYGLNRNVQLTILVGTDGKVTDNFALVQPSEQADGPKVLKAIVDVLGGGEVPTIASLTPNRRMDAAPARPAAPAGPSPELGGLIRAMIQKDATPEAVEAAARKVEAHVEKNAADRAQLARITNTIVNSDRLPTYGTEPAREYLKKWAKAYAPKPGDAPADRPLRRPATETDRPKFDPPKQD